MDRTNNYDIFKQDALKRFLTYDQETVTRRLNLPLDEQYIYVPFGSHLYRIHRGLPLMERSADLLVYEKGCLVPSSAEACREAETWQEADSNEVLSICDLLCHTTEPVHLAGRYQTLRSLNRVMGGTVSTLGSGFFGNTERFWDGRDRELAAACRALGGIPKGKGDVAYEIPIFEDIALLLQFYDSDDEFPPQLTFFLDEKICDYFFYETTWYLVSLITEQITQRVRASA